MSRPYAVFKIASLHYLASVATNDRSVGLISCDDMDAKIGRLALRDADEVEHELLRE